MTRSNLLKRGSVTLMTGLLAIPLIAMTGVAIDLARIWLVKSRLQISLGAAVLVVARDLATSGTSTDGLNLFWADFGRTSDATTVAYLGATATTPVVRNPAPGGVQLTSTATVTTTLLQVIGVRSVTVSAASTANTASKGCVLSLARGLSFTGNATVSAPNCVLASNNTNTTSSISCDGSSSVTAAEFVASGGISGCTGNEEEFRPPTTDPFAAVKSVTIPPVAASATACQSMPTLSGTVSLTSANTYEGGSKMFCNATFGHGHSTTTFTGDLKLTNGNTLNLVPGTYIFYDSMISLQGGTVQCPTCTSANGVTIILTGSAAGLASNNTISLGIDGGATVNLHAPSVNGFNSAFDGILFYMDQRESNSGGTTRVTINGGATTVLSGGMYFPSVDVKFSGNTSGGSTCTELVAGSLTFTGDSKLDISNCAAAPILALLLRLVM